MGIRPALPPSEQIPASCLSEQQQTVPRSAVALSTLSHARFNSIPNWDIIKVTLSCTAMNFEANRTIGRYLKQTRVRQGLTQIQLAEELGRPQSFVSKVESGERSLHLSEVFEYARALGVPIDTIARDIESSLD